MRRFLNQQLLNQQTVVFALLIAIAVVGRMGRFDWNFTPVAASAIFAGFYFRNRLAAAVVPLAALALSDLFEPAHSNGWVMLTVWVAMLLPAMLGPWLARAASISSAVRRGAMATLLPSAVFYLTTNFAVWLTAPVTQYTKDLAGMAACYTAAIPFYRSMIAGDLFYSALLFGAFFLAAVGEQERATGRRTMVS